MRTEQEIRNAYRRLLFLLRAQKEEANGNLDALDGNWCMVAGTLAYVLGIDSAPNGTRNLVTDTLAQLPEV